MDHVAKREDIEKMNTAIEKAKNSILRWLVGTVIAAFCAVAAVLSQL